MRILIFWLLGGVLAAQTNPLVLSEDDFLQLVAEYHPMTVSADLQRDRAEAVMRMARGGFDPKVYGDLSQKYFKGTRYYSVIEGGVKVPTWFGVELNAAYERNDGTYLNPENRVPEAGLYAAGLTVSLGRGLLFDERRAEIQRARIYQRAAVTERRRLRNKVLFEAGKAYWEWVGAYGVVNTYEEAVQLARTRFAAVVEGARLGDSPAIDTLESGIQVQNRQLALETARLDLLNSVTRLNAFLWIDGVVPVELEDNTVPPAADLIVIAPLVESGVVSSNPDLELRRIDLEQLKVDEKLQREQLKPRFDVKYNALMGGGGGVVEEYTPNNYKWGVTLSQPLLLRKERGKLQLTRIKQSETQLKLSDQTADLAATLQQSENEANATAVQYDLAVQIAADYARLLAGERELFRAGESSLFLVNSREVSFIQATIKQVELLVKHRKARLEREFLIGRLAD